MSAETLFLQEQVLEGERQLEELVSEQKNLRHGHGHLSHQNTLAANKIKEQEEEIEKLYAASETQIKQMSDLNRQAMAEIQSWKAKVEGSPDHPGFVTQMAVEAK